MVPSRASSSPAPTTPRWPDFFIVGAPKCGTTAMYEYLRVHPAVFMPSKKEPHYFARDLDRGTYGDGFYFVRDQARYLGLFAAATGDQRVGEASVWYLYSSEAAGAIAAKAPRARIVAMLRNPVEMLHSLHAQRLASGAEDIRDFAEALAAEPERRLGRRIPPRTFNQKGLWYREVVRYADQLARFFDAFGREQVLVLLYEDFAADPAAAYARVCVHLGVEAGSLPQFRVVNPNTVARWAWLRDFLRQPPQAALALGRLIGRTPLGGFARGAVRGTQEWLQRPERRTPLDPALRSRLVAEFSGEVQRTGALLGRDLVALWR